MTYDSDNFPSSGREKKGGGLLKGCLIGCGVVCVLGAIVAGIGGFMAYEWGKGILTEDPVIVGGWLQEIAECKVPDKYTPRFGMNFTILGKGFKLIIIVSDEVEDMQALQQRKGPPELTSFIIFSVPGQPEQMVREMFKSQRQQQGFMGPVPEGTKNVSFKSDMVEIAVANGTVQATRSTRTADEEATIEYSVMIRPDTILIAMGPEKTFDQKAFDAFLKSITVPDAEPKNGANPRNDAEPRKIINPPEAANPPKLPTETGS